MAAVFMERAGNAVTTARKSAFTVAKLRIASSKAAPWAEPEPETPTPVREVSCFVDTPISPDLESPPWRETRTRDEEAPAVPKRQEQQPRVEAKNSDDGECDCSVYTTPCESFCASDAAPSPRSPGSADGAGAASAARRLRWAKLEEEGEEEPGQDPEAAPGSRARLTNSSDGRIRAAMGSPSRGESAGTTEDGRRSSSAGADRGLSDSSSAPRASAHERARGGSGGNPLLRQATANRVKAAAAAAAATAATLGAMAPSGAPMARTTSGGWVSPRASDPGADAAAKEQPPLPSRRSDVGPGMRRDMLSGGSRRLSIERKSLGGVLSEPGSGGAADAEAGHDADAEVETEATDGAESSDCASGGRSLSRSRSRAADALLRLRREAAARNAVAPARFLRLDYVPQGSMQRRLNTSESGRSALLAPRSSTSGGGAGPASEGGAAAAAGARSEDEHTDAGSDFAPPSEANWPPAPPPSVVQLHYYLINGGARAQKTKQQHEEEEVEPPPKQQQQRPQEVEVAGSPRRLDVFIRKKAISERIISPKRWVTGEGTNAGRDDVGSGSAASRDGSPAPRTRTSKQDSRVRWQEPEVDPPQQRTLPRRQTASPQQGGSPRAPSQPSTPPLKAPQAATHISPPLPPRPPRHAEAQGRQARAFSTAAAQLQEEEARRAPRGGDAAHRLRKHQDSDSDQDHPHPHRAPSMRRNTVSGSGGGAGTDVDTATRNPLWLYPQARPQARPSSRSRAAELRAGPSRRKKSFSSSGYFEMPEELIAAAAAAAAAVPPAMRPRAETDYGDGVVPPGAADPRVVAAPVVPHAVAWGATAPAVAGAPSTVVPVAAATAPSLSPAASVVSSGVRPREVHRSGWRASVAAAVAAHEMGKGGSAERRDGSNGSASGAAPAGAAASAPGTEQVPLPSMPPLPPGSVGPYTPREAQSIIMQPWTLLPETSSLHGPDMAIRDGLRGTATSTAVTPLVADGSSGDGARPQPQSIPAPTALPRQGLRDVAAPPPSPRNADRAGEQAWGPNAAFAKRSSGGHVTHQSVPLGEATSLFLGHPHTGIGDVFGPGGGSRASGLAAPDRTASEASTVFNNELFEDEDNSQSYHNHGDGAAAGKEKGSVFISRLGREAGGKAGKVGPAPPSGGGAPLPPADVLAASLLASAARLSPKVAAALAAGELDPNALLAR